MAATLTERPTGTALAAAAWQSLRAAFRAMPVLYVLIFVVYNLFEDGHDLLLPFLLRSLPDSYRSAVSLGAFSAELLLSVPVLALGAIATHRFILLGDARPVWWRIAPKFCGWLLLLYLINSALGGIAVLLGRLESGVEILSLALAFIVGAVLFVSCVMIFPAVAVEEPAGNWTDRLKASQDRMVENFWLFIRADILVVLPFVFGVATFAVLLLLLTYFGEQQDILRADQDIIGVGVAMKIVSNLIDFPIVMLQAAIASLLYAWVTQMPLSSAPFSAAASD